MTRIWDISKKTGIFCFAWPVIAGIVCIPVSLWKLITHPIQTLTTFNMYSITLIIAISVFGSIALIFWLFNERQANRIFNTIAGIIGIMFLATLVWVILSDTIPGLAVMIWKASVALGIKSLATSIWSIVQRPINEPQWLVVFAIIGSALYLSSHFKRIDSRLDDIERLIQK